jgi:hypothetical protein
VLADVHVPPVESSVRCIDDSTHTNAAGSVMIVGCGFTTRLVVEDTVPQTLVRLYVIVSVPTLKPKTTPELLTLAIALLLLLHDPVNAGSVNIVKDPLQTDVVPVIVPAAGKVTTETGTVVYPIPQMFLTV